MGRLNKTRTGRGAGKKGRPRGSGKKRDSNKTSLNNEDENISKDTSISKTISSISTQAVPDTRKADDDQHHNSNEEQDDLGIQEVDPKHLSNKETCTTDAVDSEADDESVATQPVDNSAIEHIADTTIDSTHASISNQQKGAAHQGSLAHTNQTPATTRNAASHINHKPATKTSPVDKPTHNNAATEADPIFADMLFYISPGQAKKSISDKIKLHGGTMTKSSQEASMRHDTIMLFDIAAYDKDKLRDLAREPRDYICYSYIIECILSGEILPEEEYKAATILQRISEREEKFPEYSTSAKRRAYLPEEDAALMEFVRNHTNLKLSLRGNKIWRIASKAMARHGFERTWQSLRDRYLKHLSYSYETAVSLQTPAKKHTAVMESANNTPRHLVKRPSNNSNASWRDRISSDNSIRSPKIVTPYSSRLDARASLSSAATPNTPRIRRVSDASSESTVFDERQCVTPRSKRPLSHFVQSTISHGASLFSHASKYARLGEVGCGAPLSHNWSTDGRFMRMGKQLSCTSNSKHTMDDSVRQLRIRRLQTVLASLSKQYQLAMPQIIRLFIENENSLHRLHTSLNQKNHL